MNWYKYIKIAEINKQNWEDSLATFLRAYLNIKRQDPIANGQKSDWEILTEGYKQWERKTPKGFRQYNANAISLFCLDNFDFDPFVPDPESEENQGEEYEIDFDENDPEGSPMTWNIRTPTSQELDRQWGGEPEPPTPSVKEIEDWPVLKDEPKRKKPGQL